MPMDEVVGGVSLFGADTAVRNVENVAANHRQYADNRYFAWAGNGQRCDSLGGFDFGNWRMVRVPARALVWAQGWRASGCRS
jgi:hypothetical protein